MSGTESNKAGTAAMRAALHDLPKMAAGIFLLVSLGVNFANVICRYLFGFSIYWADEMMVYAIIWSTCLAGIAITFSNAHLNMDIVILAVSRKWQIALGVFSAALIFAMLSGMGWVAYQALQIFAMTGQKSVAMGVPMGWVHGALFAGFALSAVAVLVRIYLEGVVSREKTIEELLETSV